MQFHPRQVGMSQHVPPFVTKSATMIDEQLERSHSNSVFRTFQVGLQGQLPCTPPCSPGRTFGGVDFTGMFHKTGGSGGDVERGGFGLGWQDQL